MPQDNQQISDALKTIKSFQQRAGTRRWVMDVPLWRLMLDGAIFFIISFMTGRGVAVLYSLIAGT